MKMTKINEEELIKTIDKIANRFASTFKFGYHEIEDMKQQAWQVALEGLKDYDGKTKASLGLDGNRQ